MVRHTPAVLFAAAQQFSSVLCVAPVGPDLGQGVCCVGVGVFGSRCTVCKLRLDCSQAGLNGQLL
jgi:hypothetical protein